VPRGRAVAGAAPTIPSAGRVTNGSESRSATREGPEGAVFVSMPLALLRTWTTAWLRPRKSLSFFGGSIENSGSSLMMNRSCD